MSLLPKTSQRSEKFRCLTTLAIAALILFSSLGTCGLIEPDEGRYAEIGREMAAGGDWLIPHLNGNPHFQKPPMIYWATAVSFKFFGVNEAAARVPSALAAFGIVALTFAIGRVLFGITTAQITALVLLSCFEFFVLARTITPDMLMAFWITASIACLVFYVKRGQQWYFQIGFFAAMGLGFMTKGPIALIVPISAAIFWQRAARRAGEPFHLRWAIGLPFTIAIALSWFVIASVRHPALFDYFWRYELVERFASKTHGRSKPFWFFVPVLFAGLIPWSFSLPPLLRKLWTQRRASGIWPPTYWLLLGWVVPPFLILSVSGSKLPTYILPLFPSLTIALALWWQGKSKLRSWQKRLHGPAFFVFVAVASAQIANALFHPETLTFSPVMQAIVVAPFLIIMVCLAIWATRKPESPVDFVFMNAFGAVLIWNLILLNSDALNPWLRQQASVRPLAQKLVELKADRSPLFVWQARAFGICFYLKRLVYCTESESDLVLPQDAAQASRLLKTPDECSRLAPPGQPVYGLVRSGTFAEIFSPQGWKQIQRAGDFVLIERGAGAGVR